MLRRPRELKHAGGSAPPQGTRRAPPSTPDATGVAGHSLTRSPTSCRTSVVPGGGRTPRARGQGGCGETRPPGDGLPVSGQARGRCTRGVTGPLALECGLDRLPGPHTREGAGGDGTTRGSRAGAGGGVGQVQHPHRDESDTLSRGRRAGASWAVIQWGLRSGDLLPELAGEATQKVHRLAELGPAIVPSFGGPGTPDPTRECIGEIDGVVGTEQVEG